MSFPPSSPTDLVTELYLGYYDRAPDNTGLQFWISAYNTAILAGVNGTTELTTLANDFANSIESTAIYPYLSSPNPANAASFVTQVYANVLNRAPDTLRCSVRRWSDSARCQKIGVASSRWLFR